MRRTRRLIQVLITAVLAGLPATGGPLAGAAPASPGTAGRERGPDLSGLPGRPYGPAGSHGPRPGNASGVVPGIGGHGNAPCPGVFFEPIGDLPGDCFLSLATDVSGDGQRVSCISGADDPAVPNDGGTCPVFAYSHSNEAAGWTRLCEHVPFFTPSAGIPGGLIGLGYLQNANASHAESYTYGISPDGEWVAGYGNIEADNRIRAVVFTHGTIKPLAMLDRITAAYDVSDARHGEGRGARGPDARGDQARRNEDDLEGRIVVGYSSTANLEPLRSPGARAVYWDSWTHIQALPVPGTLRNGATVISSEAVCVSDDGGTIAGNLYYNQPLNPAHFRSMGCVWALQAGQFVLVTVLDDLPGGDDEVRVSDVSGNGRVIVGWSNSVSGDPACWNYPTTACAWRLEPRGPGPAQWSAPLALPPLPGFAFSSAGGTNEDGSVVVGTCQNVTGTCDSPEFADEAVVWDLHGPPTPPRDIAALLGAAVPAGWNVAVASRVAKDGRTIVGYGFNANFDIEGWVARIP